MAHVIHFRASTFDVRCLAETRCPPMILWWRHAPVPRLRNFAYYSSLRDLRTARECFAQLVSSSGVSKADAQALRDSFERLLQTPR
jgi:hypothetical protein